MFLKQSTAIDVVIGPFVDDSDGKTPETGLTVSQADCQLIKNAGAAAQKNDATAATHLANGFYKVPLNATDTGTVGRLTLAVNEGGALPVWADYHVIPASVYDSLFAGTDKLPVDVAEISGDATAADNLEAAADGTGYNLGGGSIVAASVTTAVETDAASRTASKADVSALATSAEIAALNDLSAADAADAVWDEALSGHVAVGSSGEAAGRLDADISTRLADADYTAPPSASSIASAVWSETTRTLSGFGTLAADVATAVWGAATRTLTAFGFAVTTDSASREASKADVSSLATSAEIAALNDITAAEVWAHETRELTSAGSGGATAQEVWEYATRTLSTSPPAAADIADAVWDEALFGHVAAGSAGEAAGRLDAAVSTRLADADYTAPPSASSIASAVWSETTRTLSGFGTLAADVATAVWGYVTRTLTSAGAGGATAQEVWEYGIRTLTSIQDALDGYTPDPETIPPPVVIPPDDAAVCRVYFYAGALTAGDIPEALTNARCRIEALPYSASGRFFSGRWFDPSYNAATGLAYWDIVREAVVRFEVPSHGINSKIQIPDSATADLTGLVS